MQSIPVTPPHSWSDVVPYAIAIVFAVPGWIVAWKSRRKQDADVEHTDAQTDETRAKTRQIEAEVTKTYNDIIRDVNKDLREALKYQAELEADKIELEADRDVIRRDRDHWKDRFEILELELEKYRHGGNGKAH